MSNDKCKEIVFQEFPEKLEAWIRVEKKLQAMKGTIHAGDVLESEFDPEEREVLIGLLDYLVKEYERKNGPLSYLMDKFGPSIVIMVLREVLGKIS